MRISTKGRYSLEALLYMAVLHGKAASTRTIGEATGISEGYLEQLFITLRKAGIVRGIRGPEGGYVPGRDLDQITIGDILRTMEGALEPVDCVSANDCPMSGDCISRGLWAELSREVNYCVDSITLADLAKTYGVMEKSEYAFL